MREPRAASLFRRQSHHEWTLSHRSPRGRRSREFNQHAGIRASTRVALHCHAGCCLARNTGVDRHPRMAGGQGLQPLVTPLPVKARPVVADWPRRLRHFGKSFGNPWPVGAMQPNNRPAATHASERRAFSSTCHGSTRPGSTREPRSAQSGLGERRATAWIASPRSVSLASCS